MMFFKFFQRFIGKRWFSHWSDNYTLAEKELSILPQILDGKSTIFDIGANRGELSFFFAIKCNAEKVFAFEPQRRMFGLLQGVAKNIKNILPVNIAFSDSSQERVLQIPLQGTGRYTPAASFEELHENNLKKEKVMVDTVDNFVDKNNLAKLDFIKCDTEGHEFAVFKGAQKTLATLRPILYIEVKEATKDPLFNILKSIDYHPYLWDNENSRVVMATDGSRIQSENYYFFPIEKEEQILKKLEHL